MLPNGDDPVNTANCLIITRQFEDLTRTCVRFRMRVSTVGQIRQFEEVAGADRIAGELLYGGRTCTLGREVTE